MACSVESVFVEVHILCLQWWSLTGVLDLTTTEGMDQGFPTGDQKWLQKEADWEGAWWMWPRKEEERANIRVIMIETNFSEMKVGGKQGRELVIRVPSS